MIYCIKNKLISDLGGKNYPVRKNNKYYYLYSITNNINGYVYYGARVCKLKNPYNDNYIGNGFRVYRDGNGFYGCNKNTLLYKSLNKYGWVNFNKSILLFFETKQDLLKAEKLIVNNKFIKLDCSLNQIVGGGNPPIGSGTNNNNYGNSWTKEMKQNLSNKKKESGIHKGTNNSKAKSAVIIDLWNNSVKKLNYIAEVKDLLNVKTYEVLKKINKFRYFVIPYDIYLKESKNIDIIANKYLKNEKVYLLINLYFKDDIKDRNKLNELTGLSLQYLSRFLKTINNESNKH